MSGLFMLVFRFPSPSGFGFHEPLVALLFPALLFAGIFQGRSLASVYAVFGLGLAGVFYWVPGVIETKGELPHSVSMLGAGLLIGWEALGLLAVTGFTRWMWRRAGMWGAVLGASLGILSWETYGFHVFAWSWGAPLGALPWLARSAAFLTSGGLSALLWGCGAAMGAMLAEKRFTQAAWIPCALLAGLLGLGRLWYVLPREAERSLDVVIVQPDFDPGVRRPGMEQDMWALSDEALKARQLPRQDVATLLLWPESSVLGRDDRDPSPRLKSEARQRRVAWLFGTEGGPLNLVRGEAGGRSSFIQAKLEPMPFGERMPGPALVRRWLDRQLGFVSQEPGELTRDSSFTITTPEGDLKIHPVICSEALRSGRVLSGLATAGGKLITNHTNDGWFERSIATDLHAAQIRLRAVEAGLPLIRATLTGKSGLFREDGSWKLWGAPRTRAVYAFNLRWRPVDTPARRPWLMPVLLGFLTAGACLAGLRRPERMKSPSETTIQ